MKFYKHIACAAGAIALLATLVSTASATRLESSSQTLRTAFRSVRFTEPFGTTTDCQVTLEGSLHTRTIEKIAGNLIGYITRADLGACSAGTATILTETLPWHVRYLGFSGTLPNITRLFINVIDSSFRVRFPSGTTCLFRTTAEAPLRGIFDREMATRELAVAELGGAIRSSCLNIVIALSSSRDRPTVLNGTASITVTLI